MWNSYKHFGLRTRLDPSSHKPVLFKHTWAFRASAFIKKIQTSVQAWGKNQMPCCPVALLQATWQQDNHFRFNAIDRGKVTHVK